MSERAGEPLFFEGAGGDSEPEPATESAGGVRPPGKIGSGLQDDDGEPKDWRSKPIEDLNLSMRAYTRFRGSGLITVGQILARTEGQIIARLERPSGQPFSHVLVRFNIPERRGRDVPLKPQTAVKAARKMYQELREKLDELGLVPLDADWDTARDVN